MNSYDEKREILDCLINMSNEIIRKSKEATTMGDIETKNVIELKNNGNYLGTFTPMANAREFFGKASAYYEVAEMISNLVHDELMKNHGIKE